MALCLTSTDKCDAKHTQRYQHITSITSVVRLSGPFARHYFTCNWNVWDILSDKYFSKTSTITTRTRTAAAAEKATMDKFKSRRALAWTRTLSVPLTKTDWGRRVVFEEMTTYQGSTYNLHKKDYFVIKVLCPSMLFVVGTSGTMLGEWLDESKWKKGTAKE